ncbi:odorant receptor 63a isoform X2 [Solenopsis invicta]|uniref:odorant receptor 63a isoform X2 n=1 Tax=Solenopsis invicta TaxID=13686 RepID=UPI00193E5E8F|nr:odorant receptor 63a isoform X2 [Solenopsis invicta]
MTDYHLPHTFLLIFNSSYVCHSYHKIYSKNTMLVHIIREYNINKTLLSRFGLWPFQNKFVRYLLPISLFVLEISGIQLEIIFLCDDWKDTELIFESFFITIAMIMFIMKLCNEFWNYNKVRHLYEIMENHWNIFTKESEMRILKNYSGLSRKLIIIYTLLVFLAIFSYVTIPLKPLLFDIIWPLNESRPRKFPMPIKKITDLDKYYVPIYCYLTTTLLLGVGVFCAVDSVYITRILHACSLFSIVNQQIEMISKPDINMKTSNNCKCCINTNDSKYCMKIDTYKSTSEEVTYKEYIICLKKYQIAREFVSLLNSMYYLVYELEKIVNAISHIVIITAILMHLLVICYSGQIIMDHSQKVFYRIYAVEWYALSWRFKSLMLITLRKSFTPCGLKTAIFSLSLETYAAMVKAGVSYFMTFLSFKD